ncbi:unnamed protein product, partial [Ectocarpus sp. 12 AP-2014]
MSLLFRRVATTVSCGFISLILGVMSAIASGAPENSDWLFLGNQSEMQHHSELDQISRDNVAELGLAWAVELPTSDGLVGNPLVRNGVVFQSGSLGRVFANRLSDGQLLWSFSPTFKYDEISLVSAWATRFNRGVALHGEHVIVAT